MELNDLRSEWKKAGKTGKTEASLVKMTRWRNHPEIRKVKSKFIIEIGFLILFLVVYYDWFDGDQKPFYANLLLVTGCSLYLLNDLLGYCFLLQSSRGSSVTDAMESKLRNINRLSVFSILISFFYAICLLLFFLSTIHWSVDKYFLLAASFVFLFMATWISYRFWERRLAGIKSALKELND